MGSGQRAFVKAGEQNHPYTAALVMQAVTTYDGKNRTQTVDDSAVEEGTPPR